MGWSTLRRCAALLSLVLVVPAATALAPAAYARTVTKTLKPWTGDGELRPGFRHVRRAGTCETSSFVSTRPDAWRCFTGNFIRAPCFESPQDEVVACLGSPWDRRAVLVRTDLDPGDRSGAARNHAWALTLFGDRCVFVSGASTTFRGLRLTYYCKPQGRSGPYLFGLPPT